MQRAIKYINMYTVKAEDYHMDNDSLHDELVDNSQNSTKTIDDNLELIDVKVNNIRSYDDKGEWSNYITIMFLYAEIDQD